MDVRVYPGKVSGTITVPSSKSLTHRALICASLAEGESKITNINYSDDIWATINVLKALGANIKTFDDYILIRGRDDYCHENLVVDCKESGSTLRFFVPLLSLFGKTTKFKGAKSLLKRPLEIYQDIYESQNLHFDLNPDCLITSGKIKATEFYLKGNISSQFISGLLFTLPLLKSDSKLIITDDFESASYVALTIEILRHFGIEVSINNREYYIKGNQRYVANSYEVETDYSQLAFFGCLATINNPLEIKTNAFNSFQGDKVIIDFLKEYGASVTKTKDSYLISPSQSNKNRFDLKDCPDLGPILMVLGTQSPGLVLNNIKRLRIKESDRVNSMEKALINLGYTPVVHENSFEIKNEFNAIENVIVDGNNDHRIVMSLAVLATIYPYPVTIRQADSINKSYPEFFNDLMSLGIKVEF